MSDLALPYVMPVISDPDLEFAKYFNFLKSLQNRRGRLAHVDSNPFDLTIDLTSACQLHCPYCATGNGTIFRKKSIIEGDMYHRIINSIGRDCFIIWYFSNGEPLLHKKFGELLATSKERHLFSIISTNLSLRLSRNFLSSLITSGLGMISVSIDGATEQTYSQYRRGGEFDLVLENVRTLVEIKRALGLVYPLIEWRFLRFKHNEHEEMAARALATELGVDLLEFDQGSTPPADSPDCDGVFECTMPLVGPNVSGPALESLEKIQIATRTLARLTPSIQVGGSGDMERFTKKCDWLYFSGMLHPTGRVGPCCVSNDENQDFVESIDNLSDYDAVFNSANYVAARRMFTSGTASHTICDKCPMPSAQHYQFRMKLRAILRAAPDWVVGLLASNPASFFLPEDTLLVPEVATIEHRRLELSRLIESNVVERLCRMSDPAAYRFRSLALA